MSRLSNDCAGKVRFDSALLAAKVVQRHREDRRKAYRCDVCGGWHLGTAKRTVHMNLRRRWASEEVEA
jgi:hypothetical protein